MFFFLRKPWTLFLRWSVKDWLQQKEEKDSSRVCLALQNRIGKRVCSILH